jgi:hypothetical protein
MRRGFEVGKAVLFRLAAALLLCVRTVTGELSAHDHSVELIASIADDPPSITLQWPVTSDAQNFQISRKVLGEQNWTPMTTIGGGETSWRDSSVSTGTAYEYQVVKNTNLGYTGWGYACAAVRRNVIEGRGKMILLVESGLGASLGPELARLQQDLVGDGWTVVPRNVAKNTSVTEVKNIIRAIYDSDPAGTKGLFLFGHLPIPRSGNICPDMHPDDQGAWPADVYYAEFDGQWTDDTVTITSSSNPNVPGDGKFDQSEPPTPVRLQMGRVDLSSMTCFANKIPSRSELDLARQYLVKDHNFRHGKFDVQRRAMIFDRFYRGMEPEPQTCAAWRSFPGFFGRENVRPIGQYEYFPILNNDSYMWSYVVSGGSVYGCDYIGTSDDWAINEPKVVFTSFLGSWFGQWEKESDFLRAPLGASGYALVSIFSGQPQWILHPMGMGETIGYAAMLTQNNNTNNGIYPPQLNAGSGQVHIDLMGDPSLRMHIVKPPGALTGTVGEGGVALNWSPSPEDVLGYYVYRSTSAEGPFTRISGDNAVNATSFTDPSGSAGSYYMVRALKLEQTPTGSYYNLSQGMFYPDATSSSAAPETPRGLAIAAISRGSVDLSWIGNFNNVRAFEIQRRTLPNGSFTKIAEAPSNASMFSDNTLSAGIYAYRVKALGFAGDSDFSSEASINFNPSWGTIVGSDKTTSGDWIGKYGSEGYALAGGATNLPSYATFNTANVNFVMGKYTSDDEPETLWYPDGQHRFLGFWINNHRASMVFNFRFNDEKTHRVTFYLLDYKSGVRAGTISVVDPYSGTEFGSLYFNNYSAGQYVTIDVRNYVNVVFTPEFVDSYGVYLDAIFFDPAPQTGAANQATFVGVDTAAQGDWKTKYGSDGQVIAGLGSSLPTDVVVNHSNQTWTWDTSSGDPRALNKYSDSGRVAAAWYSPGQCVFDVNINSAQPKQVALYLLDWDNSGRVEDITVTDAANGATLLTKRIDKFSGGQYLIFNAKGSIRIAAKLVSGPNAVVNGIFFGDAPKIVSSDPARLSVSTVDVSSGSYIIRIAGQPGQVFDIETSSDFRSWTKVGQQTLSGTSIDFPIPFAVVNEIRCYRAVLAQ